MEPDKKQEASAVYTRMLPAFLSSHVTVHCPVGIDQHLRLLSSWALLFQGLFMTFPDLAASTCPAPFLPAAVYARLQTKKNRTCSWRFFPDASIIEWQDAHGRISPFARRARASGGAGRVAAGMLLGNGRCSKSHDQVQGFSISSSHATKHKTPYRVG